MRRAHRFVVPMACMLAALSGCGQIHKSVQSDELVLLNAESSYLNALDATLASKEDLKIGYDAAAFLSANAISGIMKGLDGITLQPPTLRDAKITVDTIRPNFRDGFPEVICATHVTIKGVAFSATIHAILEPRIDEGDQRSLSFLIHPISISGTTQLSGQSIDLPTIANEALRALAINYIETLPHIQVPISKSVALEFNTTSLPITVPVQGGKLHGEVDLPSLSNQAAISIGNVIFLADGIHAFVVLGDNKNVALMTPTLQEIKTPSSLDELQKLVSQKQADNEALRAKLAPKLASTKITDGDFSVWLSQSLLSYVMSAANNLTPAQRVIHYHTLSQEGQLYRQTGGGVGCGGYADVVGGNSASADLQISNFSITWNTKGASASADLSLSFHAQVTGHVNGPAGPHTFMTLQCVNLGFARPCTDVPSVTVSCDTPIGGGVGLGSYGVSGQRTENIGIDINLHSDPANWLVYDMAIARPDSIPITVQVGLGQLGSVGLPFNFSIPHQVIASGKAPPLIGQSGRLTLPPPLSGTKDYAISVVPTGSAVDQNGYTAHGTIATTFQ